MLPEAPMSSECAENPLGIGLILVAASSREGVTGLHEESPDGSPTLDLISSPDFHSGTCFTVDKIWFRQCPMEWESTGSRVRRTGYSSGGSRRRRLYSQYIASGASSEQGKDGRRLCPSSAGTEP